MGCCGETPTNIPSKENKHKKMGPASRADTGDFLQVDEMVQQQRRLTKAERQSQAEAMISARGVMKFKVVEKFSSLYSKRREVGSGAFGTVHIGAHRKTNMPCAIKTVKKTKLNEAEVY